LDERLEEGAGRKALSAEMDYHLGAEGEAENSRNGYGRKTVSTGTGKIDIEVPRTGRAASIRN
jgi:putative transposase